MTQNDIQAFIDEYVNPALEDHGGYLKIIKYDEADECLYVELGGGCQGCSMSKETLHIQIKSFLIDEFPNLKEIKDVTDHAAGANPYYRSDDET